jgi:hypothetical protein
MTVELSSRHEHRLLALAGALGGALYLTGDFLYYGTFSAGVSFHSLSIMAQRSDLAIVASGALAPIASVFYVLGTLAVYLALNPGKQRLPRLFFVSWSVMFLVGVAYHAVFAVRGFAARIADAATRQRLLDEIGALHGVLYIGELALALMGTAALVIVVWRRGTQYPRWILLFMPTVWILLDFIPRQAPAPIGSLLVGGWTNGWFTIFFIVSWAILRSSQRDFAATRMVR